jgi:hypothetical protein
MGSKKCNFFLIRYIPDTIRNEFVNIGVVLCEIESENPTTIVRITRNWTRVLCMDPLADTAMLEGIETHLRREFNEAGADASKRLAHLQNLLSHGIQIADSVQTTSPKGLLTQNLETEIDLLMQMYVEAKKP